MACAETKKCPDCEKALRFLRERCEKLGLKVSLSDEDFWWYCVAENAVTGLVLAAQETGQWGPLLELAKLPPKKRKARTSAIIAYVLSKFPSPAFRSRLASVVRAFLPECFGDGDPGEVLRLIERTERDAEAARFLFRARGIDVALPEGFDEEHARTRYEICVREYALRVFEGDPRTVAIRKMVNEAFREYHGEIARLREKLSRGARLAAEKAAEAEYYKNVAEEALRKAQEAEEFYQAEIEALQRRVKELERELARTRVNEPVPAPLDGVRVLVLGDPAREGDVAAALETLGTETVYLDAADESFDANLVRSANLVIVAGDYGRHGALYKLKSEARRRGVPVVTVPAGTASQVRNAVLRHFGLEIRTNLSALARA